MATLPRPDANQRVTVVLDEPGGGIGLIPIVDSTGRIITVIGAGSSSIGNVTIDQTLSDVATVFDHGSNRDIDATAEQITSTSYVPVFGVLVKADAANTGILYIGNSDVTAGTTAGTDGMPLSAGESLLVKINNVNKIYAIGSAANQVVYWMAV